MISFAPVEICGRLRVSVPLEVEGALLARQQQQLGGFNLDGVLLTNALREGHDAEAERHGAGVLQTDELRLARQKSHRVVGNEQLGVAHAPLHPALRHHRPLLRRQPPTPLVLLHLDHQLRAHRHLIALVALQVSCEN